jgi:hypothetical protein
MAGFSSMKSALISSSLFVFKKLKIVSKTVVYPTSIFLSESYS